MKFICNQQELSKALNTVSKAVSSRTTIPILKGILLSAEKDNTLTLTASDLEISIQKSIDVEVLEEGKTVVLSKLFNDIIRKLPQGNITVELINDKIMISNDKSHFNIVCMDKDDFPKIGENEEIKDKLSFDKDIFKNMIRKTYFAASIEEAKGVLVGILVDISEEMVTMVALDGFRLALINEEMRSDKVNKFIVAAKIMNEISKIIDEEEDSGELYIYLYEKKSVINIGNTKVSLRLMEGDYINYKDIIPFDNTISIKVDRKELLESIERASILSKEGNNKLIKMTISEEELVITSRSEEGDVKEILEIKKDGDDLDIGFNSKYVIDVLKIIEDDKIKMSFKTGISPCLITPIDGEYFKYLVLPVRIPAM